MFVSLGVSVLLFGISLFLRKKEFFDYLKLSPFECGFSSLGGGRGSFSNQFFLIRIFFLIFDTELVLIFPFLYLELRSPATRRLLLFVFFFIILSIGVGFEWSQSKLEWLKYVI